MMILSLMVSEQIAETGLGFAANDNYATFTHEVLATEEQEREIRELVEKINRRSEATQVELTRRADTGDTTDNLETVLEILRKLA